ncbi:SDR family oxidoreductase [Paraburkholderia sp. A1RI-2L]|uniref:UDP-glucuronic acid decarboxylase family protein n=1 Tax=Paraburkholderia sp. A1RI-2L TaxID=3028367 RepID=UPI003B7C91C0
MAKELSSKRILVTGGAGFLGSHLCERLVSQGHDVLCVDNFYTGSKRNVAHLLDNANFEVMRHDVTFPLYVEVDEIYNLACPASPIHYQHDPVQTTKTSVHGAINMLGLARRLHAKLLQASTSEVYGDARRHPQTEDYWGHVNPVGPRACYDEGKRCAETLCMDYRRQHGLDVRIARIFNTYGPRMHPRDGRVISNFVMQALAGEALSVYGTGLQTRCFCYVEDLLDGLMRLMELETAPDGPVNLGNPDEISMIDTARRIIALAHSDSSIAFKPLPLDDPCHRRPSIDKARAVLGWQPHTPLDAGLNATIAYFRRFADSAAPPCERGTAASVPASVPVSAPVSAAVSTPVSLR